MTNCGVFLMGFLKASELHPVSSSGQERGAGTKNSFWGNGAQGTTQHMVPRHTDSLGKSLREDNAVHLLAAAHLSPGDTAGQARASGMGCSLVTFCISVSLPAVSQSAILRLQFVSME
ncbi:hypothetical protein GN956_G5007 [Arapaima gigas]